ncbi:hypothetical protein NDU88_001212 [Pleurodeles waltl]|uniref:Uncharacterized protein n=1 Tax=Pleurodeles waltl TaxID=8319 RepID=A0AAV7U5R3_PLEWA|nr:hypothetical protein NDU88_001212 [Pleurodeles waltl]
MILGMDYVGFPLLLETVCQLDPSLIWPKDAPFQAETVTGGCTPAAEPGSFCSTKRDDPSLQHVWAGAVTEGDGQVRLFFSIQRVLMYQKVRKEGEANNF